MSEENQENVATGERAVAVESSELLSFDDVRCVIYGGVYCKKCDGFLGSTCDPFRPLYHEHCFELVSAEEKTFNNNSYNSHTVK